MSDTIAAIATAPGPSAIGVVRLSGPDTCAVLDRVFRPKNGRPMSRQEPRRLVLGDVLDRDGQVIDSALAVLFPGPGSYTGQDCGELQCHGSPVVLDAALAAMRYDFIEKVAAESVVKAHESREHRRSMRIAAGLTFCRRRPGRT